MNSCNYLINNKHESSKTSTQKLRCCCYWRSGFNLGLGKNSGMVPTQMNCKICGTPPLHWTSTQHILHQAVFSSILPSPVLFISTKCSFCFYDKFIRGGHIVIIPPRKLCLWWVYCFHVVCASVQASVRNIWFP